MFNHVFLFKTLPEHAIFPKVRNHKNTKHALLIHPKRVSEGDLWSGQCAWWSDCGVEWRRCSRALDFEKKTAFWDSNLGCIKQFNFV